MYSMSSYCSFWCFSVGILLLRPIEIYFSTFWQKLQDSCTITYNAVDSTGWYGVAVQVEDYFRQSEVISSQSNNGPLSSIPLQFLVFVYESAGATCDERSQFVYPTLAEESCIAVPQGSVFESSIVARVSNGSERQVDTRRWQITILWVYYVLRIKNFRCKAAR